jgi:membrane-associated protease RseP (regulator of RpoE activity)
MKYLKTFFGILVAFVLLSSGLASAHSGGLSSSAAGDHQRSPMQGSGTKQGVMPQRSDAKSPGGAGMDGCNIAPETGWLGLEVIDLDKSIHADLDYGIEVKSIIPGGPAEKAGIKAGDVLLTLDGKAIKSIDQLENSVMGFPVGYNAELGVKRGDQEKKMMIKVEKKQSFFAGMPMMAGGGNMPGNLRPGMFMEDMMKRSPIGQMKQNGMKPGPGMVFGNGGGVGERQKSESPTSALTDRNYDIISQYLSYKNELNLSSDQVTALKKHKREIDKLVVRLDAAIKVAQIEMEELLNENQVDMDKVENKIREIEKNRTERSLKQIRLLTKAKNILTEEQLEKFKRLSSNF